MRWTACVWSMIDDTHGRMIHDGVVMIRTALVLLLLTTTPVAADIQAGINAMGRGNYPKAVEIFQPLAEGGDWNAQGFLANTYILMENNREAYAWFYATAKCGSKDAEIELYMLEPKLNPATIERGKTLGDIYYDRYCR